MEIIQFKNIMNEIKTLHDGLKGRVEMTEDRIHEFRKYQ